MNRYVLLCLLAAVLFGFMPSFARFAYADGANVLFVLLIRSIVGFVILVAYPIITGAKPDFSLSSFKLTLPAGVAHILAAIGVLAAIVYVDIALAMVIVFLYPFPIAAYDHFKGRTRLTLPILGLMVAALVGLGFVLGPDFENINGLGIAFALLGAAGFTVMIISLGQVSREIGAINSNVLLTFWAAIVFAVAAIIGPALGLIEPMKLPATSYGWVMAAGVGATFSVGYLLFFIAAVQIGTARASLLSISEPVLMILFAIALLGETVGIVEWLGIALVISSLAGTEVLRSKSD